MKKLPIALVTTIVVTALVTYAFSFDPGWDRGHGGAGSYGPTTSFLSQLNLTPEQTAKINALREAFLRDIKPLRDKMFSKRGDLRLLWLQTNPDQNKIIAAQREIRALRDQLQDKVTTYRLDVLKILTPEQQEKVKSFRLGRGFGPGARGGLPGMSPGPGMGGDPGTRGNW